MKDDIFEYIEDYLDICRAKWGELKLAECHH